MKTKYVRFATYFTKLFLTAAPRCFYYLTLGVFFRPKKVVALLESIQDARDVTERDSILKSVSIESLFNMRKCEIDMNGDYLREYFGGTHSIKELAALAYLMRVLRPSKVFEIGTFRGRTTALLARNATKNAAIYTLDLPQARVNHKVGECFRAGVVGGEIVQLEGDTRDFDFRPWQGACDLVWVDACHDYDYVVKDTANAILMCRPGGIVAWHDYRHTIWYAGVTRCVRETSKKYADVWHIFGTTIAIMKVS